MRETTDFHLMGGCCKIRFAAALFFVQQPIQQIQGFDSVVGFDEVPIHGQNNLKTESFGLASRKLS